MQNALVFVFRTLIDLYILTFVLRFILQWVRVDHRNPLAQALFRLTNPLVIPLRRKLPPFRGVDTATAVIVLVLECAATFILLKIACIGTPDVLQLILLSILRLARMLLQVYFFLIIGYVILSWISPGGYGNPATALLAGIVEPALAPIRRVIPSVAGLDLSPLFAAIFLQALTMMLPFAQFTYGLTCGNLALIL